MEMQGKELTHHGIKGQHWGVRRGPPYPLGTQTRSDSENLRRSGGLGESEKKSEIGTIGDSGTAKSKVTKDAEGIAKKYGFSIKSVPSTVGEDIKNANPDWYNHQDDKRWLNNCSHSCVAFAARRKGLDVVASPMTDRQAELGGETMLETCNRYFKHKFEVTDSAFTMVNLQSPGSVISQTFLGIDVTRNGASYEKKASSELGKVYRDVPDGGYGIVYS